MHRNISIQRILRLGTVAEREAFNAQGAEKLLARLCEAEIGTGYEETTRMLREAALELEVLVLDEADRYAAFGLHLQPTKTCL